jgi:hypothetical protein
MKSRHLKIRFRLGSQEAERNSYPQEQEKIRLFPRWQFAGSIVLLDTSGGITFDALTWIFEQGISLVQIDWRGRVTNKQRIMLDANVCATSANK